MTVAMTTCDRACGKYRACGKLRMPTAPAFPIRLKARVLCDTIKCARIEQRYRIAAITDRKSVFTASEDRNTTATSGSRTTASTPSVIFWSEPIGFGSLVIEPALLPHRITSSPMRLRIQRFLRSPLILDDGIVGFSTLSVELGNWVSPRNWIGCSPRGKTGGQN